MNIKLFKKAILLIHGFAGGSYDYNSLNNDLELYNCFDVFTFTLPGHERMIIDKVTRKDWIKKAEDELEKIINAGYGEVYIIGHSMGGVIASYLASKYKQVKKLVLAAPAFHYLSFKGNKVDVIESIKKLPNLFKNYDPEEVLSRLFKIPVPTIKEFMKLVEEVGEVAEVLNKRDGRKASDSEDLKSQLANELADVIHYAFAIASLNEIDLNDVILEKDKKASIKYNHERNLEQFMLER